MLKQATALHNGLRHIHKKKAASRGGGNPRTSGTGGVDTGLRSPNTYVQ